MSLYKERIKLSELNAMIELKHERLKEIEDEAAKLRAELVLLTNELLRRSSFETTND